MSGIAWVYIMLGIYTIYCFYEGLKGFFTEKTSQGYAIAGRSIPFFAFLLAATAASFSGWTFIGHPGLIWQDGLSYAFASFYVLTIPITGALFSKRTWFLGKRYGFITPGDMYAYYYNSEAIRFLVVLTSVFFSVLFTAVQIKASAALFHIIAGVDVTYGAFFMAFIVWFYVCAGGIRASVWVGAVQCVLLVSGIIILGYYVVTGPAFGGWAGFSASMNGLDKKFLEVPRVINFGLGGAEGEVQWTAVMILTYLFALMGIQASPAFTLWNFGLKSPKPLAWQQTFMSTFVVGFALFFFAAIQGMGAKILQFSGAGAFQNMNQATVVPTLMKEFLPPVLLGLVFLSAIAAIHSTAAPYINTGGSILLRDIYWRHIRNQKSGDAEQIWVNRICATLLTGIALFVGLTSTAALVILGALATAFGFILYILLLGIIWGFRFPSKGAVLGVISGMIVIVLTYAVWPNPLSMHCSFWGLFSGLLVSYSCRLIRIRDSEKTLKRQLEVRLFLDNIDFPSESGKRWRKAMKIAVPVWFLFAIGPACLLGNSAFSFAGFPPLWSWQIVWWTLGIILMWALCFKSELSTVSEAQILRAEEERMVVVKGG
ncbi:MAG: sodium:solute symporter family protein [Desulfobacteraceae bacterium]|nr:MAG: sodium:solute symporter family protein [Desulfobacteraceae bacterium]